VHFVHADVGWKNEGDLEWGEKWEWEWERGRKMKERLRGGCIKWASKECGVANCSCKGQ
jgi:hypothetical protein